MSEFVLNIDGQAPFTGVLEAETTLPAGNTFRVKRDQFTVYQFSAEDAAENGIRKSAPAPAVMRTGEINNHKYFQRATLTRVWQLFWADLLSMFVYGKLFSHLVVSERDEIISAFNGMSASNRAFNNDKGTNNCNNFVEGIMRGEDPKHDPLICCDDWVEVLETQTNSKNIVMARLKSFKQNEVPPVVTKELLKDPRVLWATIITADGVIRNFPQLNGLPCPYPYLTVTDCWYPLVDLEKVT